MQYPVQVIGINYKTAQLSELAKVQWADSIQTKAFIDQVKRVFGISEVFFLCTCNRREFYLSLVDRDEQTIDPGDFIDLLQSSLKRTLTASSFFNRKSEDAVIHIFRVASSLESMVLGETEITKQIRDQTARAFKSKMIGRTLNSLLTEALKTAKCVRTRTAITKNVVSMSSLTYRKVMAATKHDSEKTVVFLGAGHFMRSIMPHFAKADLKMVFVNRTRPVEMKRIYGGEALELSEFLARPIDFDAMVSATAAPTYVITKKWLAQSLPSKPRIFIDLAVPRDLDPEIAELPDQDVQSLGQMQAELEVNREARETEIPKAYPIFMEALERLDERMMELRLSKIHSAITKHYQFTGARALDHLLHSSFEDISHEDAEKLKRWTRTLVSKLVTVPILGLKGVARTHGRSGVEAYTQNVAASTKLFNDSSSIMP